MDKNEELYVWKLKWTILTALELLARVDTDDEAKSFSNRHFLKEARRILNEATA